MNNLQQALRAVGDDRAGYLYEAVAQGEIKGDDLKRLTLELIWNIEDVASDAQEEHIFGESLGVLGLGE